MVEKEAAMYCYHHPDRDAIGGCVSCGQAVCPECKVEYRGKVYCNPCIEKMASGGGAPATAVTTGNTSGMGSKAPIPPGLGEWNWGGFLLTWMWGIGNNVWWSFLVFVPYLGFLVMPWVLAFKGNEWAWQSRRWQSVEHFNRVQRTWMLWGLWTSIALTIIITVILLLFAGLIIWGLKQSGTIR